MKLGRIAFFIGFGLIAAAAVAAYGWLTFEQPPGFSELPQSWFARPSSADPGDWRLPGAVEVKIETLGFARLQIVPEDRADIAASGPFTRRADGALVVTGLGRNGCHAPQGPKIPVVALHTPRSLTVRAKGPFAAEIGPAQGLLIDSDGCADWRVASAQTLWIAERDGAQVRAGPVVDLRLARWGAGEDRIAATSRTADVVVHGKGSVLLAKAYGIVEAAVWGGGRIDIGPGFVGRERIWVKGPGRVLHHGQAGEVTGEARHGGKIRVHQATGVITGSGDIQVGRPATPLAGL
jgi:hypothetical protein